MIPSTRRKEHHFLMVGVSTVVLTWWEQIDNDKQLARTWKFSTVVPVVLQVGWLSNYGLTCSVSIIVVREEKETDVLLIWYEKYLSLTLILLLHKELSTRCHSSPCQCECAH